MAVLSKKIAKDLGSMSGIFEGAAQKIYDQVLSELKAALAKAVDSGKQDIAAAVKESFGTTGLDTSKKFMAPVLKEITEYLFTAGLREIDLTLNDLLKNKENIVMSKRAKRATAAKKLLGLAYMAHARGGRKEAQTIVSLAFDAEDAPEMMEELINEEAMVEDAEPTEEEIMDELEGLVDEDESAEAEEEDDMMEDELDVEELDDFAEAEDEEDEENDGEEFDESDFMDISEASLRKLKATANEMSAQKNKSLKALGRRMQKCIAAARIKKVRI